MADRRDKLNKTLIMIGIVSAVVVIIIAKIFQMKPQSLISVIAVIWAACCGKNVYRKQQE